MTMFRISIIVIAAIFGAAYLSHATVIGPATSDQIGDVVAAGTDKTTIADGDMIAVVDLASGNVLQKMSWLNFKTAISGFIYTGAGSAGKVICWKTATTLGYCSSVVGITGECTCN